MNDQLSIQEEALRGAERALNIEPLFYNGVGRNAEHDKSVLVYFNRPLTNVELRFLADVLGRTVPLMHGVEK